MRATAAVTALAGLLLAGTCASAGELRALPAGLDGNGLIMAKAYGPSFPTMEGPAREPNGDMGYITKQSIGCLAMGTIATIAAMSASENALNIIGGGLVTPANTIVLYLGLGGLVFASFCAVGHAVTPLVLHFFETPAQVPSPTRPGDCRNCREARPYDPVTPVSFALAAPATAAPTRPAQVQAGPKPAFVAGVPALRAALR
jgi:hypothetical protein